MLASGITVQQNCLYRYICLQYIFIFLFIIQLLSCVLLFATGLQHARLPCSSPSPRVFSNSYPVSRQCHPTISSSVVPFSSCLQSFPASGSFPVSQIFVSAGQSIGASASAAVLSMTIQHWFPLRLTGLVSLQSRGLSRVFSSTTTWKQLIYVRV